MTFVESSTLDSNMAIEGQLSTHELAFEVELGLNQNFKMVLESILSCCYIHKGV